MTTLVDVVVPIATKSTNSKLRVHWRVNRRTSKAEREATALCLRQGAAPFAWAMAEGQLTVTLTRLSERYLDDDNVRGALKAVRDEVAAWLGVDDRDPRVTWAYAQQQVKRGHFGVRVVVTTTDEARGAA